MQEQELFNNYEVKTWEFGPRFYKILAVSALINVLGIAIIGQSNLLTKKGCDSPMVEKVCTVIDAIVVGEKVLTTESRMVDEAYNPTEITSEDEIVWVPVDDRLQYPEGYFQVANPEMFQNPDPTQNPAGFESSVNTINPTIPGIPNSSNPTIGNPTVGNPLDKPQVLPKPIRRKKGAPDPLADFSFNDDPTKENPTTDNPTVKNRDRVVNKDPKVAENDPKTNDPAEPKEIVINKKPLKDLVPKVKEKLGNGMALNSPFVVQANGKLESDGRIKNIKFTNLQGADPNMIDVVKSSVAAINESGYLQYLSLISGKTLNLQFAQDATNVSAVLQSEMGSETRAKSVTGLLDLLIKNNLSSKESKLKELQAQLAQTPDNEELKKQIADDTDDLALLKYATVGQDGKKLVIKFEIPQDVAQGLIQRKLNEVNVEETKKPNSSAQVITKAQSTGR